MPKGVNQNVRGHRTGATHDELMTALNHVLMGKRYISPGISEKVIEGYLDRRKAIKPQTSWETLTHREREIVKLIAEGYPSKEIADYFCISVKTVDKHRANLMKTLDLHNVSVLTALAIEKGWLAASSSIMSLHFLSRNQKKHKPK
jgi:two-component system, NarL family, response regulator NreC